MIEYANESIMKLLKQYDMLSKSLNFTMELTQKKDICDQMTKIIQNVLEQTNIIYEEKYEHLSKRSVYLMDEEKTKLLELINLINERRAYVNNQITNNFELTGIDIPIEEILGEDQLEEYKSQVKIIDKYKNNIKLESVLTEELKSLDVSIKKANEKINNNQNLNRQLEEKMIKILENAFKKLSLYELKEREKEIDLAYTELGYSLEKAKENAKVARRDYSEEIILECDNMLAAITLEYERYKEKKLILKLIYIYKNPVKNYEELLKKREEINSILMSITDSDLWKMVGNELNKEYATIKLEAQDTATLKSLIEERDIKNQTLKEIDIENNSAEFKGLLAALLENEKKYQEQLRQEKKKKEQERLAQERQEEKRKLEEIAKRQKAIEEERKKEIEQRTKQLLVEKKKPVLMTTREEKLSKEEKKREIPSQPLKGKPEFKRINPEETLTRNEKIRRNSPNFSTRSDTRQERNKTLESRTNTPYQEKNNNIFNPSYQSTLNTKDDFFAKKIENNKIVDRGIPVIKNNNLDNKVVAAKKTEDNNSKIFPEIPLEKKDAIFPEFPDMNTNNTSFFDENEFNDLNNYMENNKKKSWF